MENSIDYIFLNRDSYKLRRRFLELFTRIGYGHVTSAFSITEILIYLYSNVLHYKIEDDSWEERDRLVISKGHGAGMLFPVLEEFGLIKNGELDNIIRIGGDYSRLQRFFYPGFQFYGGSLGIGIGIAAGLALGALLNQKKWKTYCILGDAECYEGSVWEAAMFAGHNKLMNLTVIVDRNKLGCSDFTEHMLNLEPLVDKWNACNWDVTTVNGHSYRALDDCFNRLKQRDSAKPLCIIADTVKGKGLDSFCNKPIMHGYMPKGDNIKRAFDELDQYCKTHSFI